MISLDADKARQAARIAADQECRPYVVVREHLSDPTTFFYSVIPLSELQPYSVVQYETRVPVDFARSKVA